MQTLKLNQNDPLLSVPQVAQMLGIGTRMVYRLVDERRIEYIKIGKHLRFRPNVIFSYLNENTFPRVR
jgi:excisionase family DNA binding protein